MKKIITAFVFCFLCGECFSQAGEWVWIKGDSIPNQPGSYGVQGVPSPTNNPPSLYEPCEWTDLNGNFWLFGGALNGVTCYGDLWKYNHLTNEWTWMKGPGVSNNAGNYGIQGVSSPANQPTSRAWGITSWTDDQGNLWMFGGYIMGNGSGAINDLWKYDISTNEWTWVKGPGFPGVAGIYGTQGVPSPSNNPPTRYETSVAWIDNAGGFWLFGGINSGLLNDLWRYNISSSQWAWMKGDSIVNQPGTYGTLGVENAANKPGARQAYAHWKDAAGNFWLFGGGFGGSIRLNDLWRYNIISNNWTWMNGDSTTSAGIYGTKCIATAVNMPGSRFEHRAAWTDQWGNFILFGGMESGDFNDLWKYCIYDNLWVWIGGDNGFGMGGYWGVQGVSGPFNKPNPRRGSIGWRNNINQLFLYGGVASGSIHNDLWRFTLDPLCGVCSTVGVTSEIPGEQSEITIYPNPANTFFTVSIPSAPEQNIQLRIYNTLGKQVYFSKEEITKGKFEKEINVEKWSDGIYFLQVKTKEGNMNRKVIVSHP